MKRILVIVPFPMSTSQLENRKEQSHSVKLDHDTEISYLPVKASPRTFVSQEDYVLADISILEAGLKAEKNNFDAVCIDTVSDSGVAALRSVLNIPVIGPGRTMFLSALMLGEKFSIISMWEEWFGLYKKTLSDLNIWEKCASMRAINYTPDNRNLLSGKENEVFPMLLKEAKKCITEDGADVICLGSTTMHQASIWLSEKLPIPVINPGPLSYKIAEVLLSLDLSQSRKAYPKPKVPRHDMVHLMLESASKADTDRKLEKL